MGENSEEWQEPVMISTRESLQEQLISVVPEEERCPHLRIDSKGPYCGNGYRHGNEVSEGRRMICDTSSLQLYCLDKSRCDICVAYKKAPN